MHLFVCLSFCMNVCHPLFYSAISSKILYLLLQFCSLFLLFRDYFYSYASSALVPLLCSHLTISFLFHFSLFISTSLLLCVSNLVHLTRVDIYLFYHVFCHSQIKSYPYINKWIKNIISRILVTNLSEHHSWRLVHSFLFLGKT
jgi:hypothetical protein